MEDNIKDDPDVIACPNCSQIHSRHNAYRGFYLKESCVFSSNKGLQVDGCFVICRNCKLVLSFVADEYIKKWGI